MAERALIVVDVLNEYEHDDAETLRGSAGRALPAIEQLLEQARERDVLTVYVNDNLEDWTLDRSALVERVLAGPHAGLVGPLAPRDDVAFVLKGRHSIFWETPLAYLLRRADVQDIVLCGQVTEQCILYSALDAHIRHLGVRVVENACATIIPELADAALTMMRRNMGAEIVPVDGAFGTV